jgi:hypothetical protein
MSGHDYRIDNCDTSKIYSILSSGEVKDFYAKAAVIAQEPVQDIMKSLKTRTLFKLNLFITPVLLTGLVLFAFMFY